MTRRGFVKGILGAAAVAAFPVVWTYNKAKSKFLTGARAKLYIDGKLVGEFNSVNISYETPITPHHEVLGRYEPVEFGPIKMTATLTNEDIMTAGTKK